MPCVFFSEMLTCEDVPKVGAAVNALNLRSLTIWVSKPLYRTMDFFIEAWPAAVCFKLVFGAVQFCAAAFADVGAFFPECIVFACEGHFGAFVNYDLLFFRGERFEVGLFFRSGQ